MPQPQPSPPTINTPTTPHTHTLSLHPYETKRPGSLQSQKGLLFPSHFFAFRPWPSAAGQSLRDQSRSSLASRTALASQCLLQTGQERPGRAKMEIQLTPQNLVQGVKGSQA